MSISYDMCVICEKVKANPLHVKVAHGMAWGEYKQLSKDENFMKEVEEHRERREKRDEKEFHMSRLLTYHWFPKASTLTGVIRRFTEHAKSNKAFTRQEVDLSKFEGLKEAVVNTVIIAEAMTKDGWECVEVKGGHDRSPKEYHMKKL